MQETRVWSLLWEDPTCQGATKLMRHNYWSPHALASVLPDKRSHCDEKPEHHNIDPAHHNYRKPVHSKEDPAQPEI